MLVARNRKICNSKLLCLTNEITNHTINLLDHGLCEYLCFRADLDIGYFAPSDV